MRLLRLFTALLGCSFAASGASLSLADSSTEKAIQVESLEKIFTPFHGAVYRATLVQGWFLLELRDRVHTAKIALERAKQSRDPDDLQAVVNIMRGLDSLAAFVVTVESATSARLEPGKGAAPRLYENSPCPFLLLVDNPQFADASVALEADPGIQFQLHSSPSVTSKDFQQVVIGVLRASTIGPQLLRLRLTQPASAPSQPLEVKLNVQPLVPVTLSIRDYDGQPGCATFEFRDTWGNLFPSGLDRSGPDLSFQPHVYRRDGETVRLPADKVQMKVYRGPEYQTEARTLRIKNESRQEVKVRLKRWIHLPQEGFYSGDTHMHPLGCRHFRDEKGLKPEEFFVHLLGEDLNVGHVLLFNYGLEGFQYHEQFFQAGPHPLSRSPYLMKYDLEVSGFPSSHMGHPVLLNLSSTLFPRASWNLPIFDWVRQQPKALGGYAHPTLSRYGFNLPYDFAFLDARELPVDLILGKVDTYEMFNQDRESELFLYYRLLNCGLRLTPVGGSDFPCIFDRRVGSSRVYARLKGELAWPDWIEAIREGRTFAGDGQGFVWLTVEGHEPGASLAFDGPTPLQVSARGAIRPGGLLEQGKLEIIVNGDVVASKILRSSGRWHTLETSVNLQKSAWVAARLLYSRGGQPFSEELGSGRHYYCSAHTGPLYLRSGDKPVRVAKRDAQWILGWIEAAWEKGKGQIAKEEIQAAQEAFEEARRRYRQILQEAP